MAISTFDARDGFSSEVLQDLHAAQRVVIALKDRDTAALGCWIRTQRPDQQDTEEFRLVILRASASVAHGISDEQPPTIGAAQDDLFWQEALKHLQPGDVGIVQGAVGWAAVSLTVTRQTPKRTGPWEFGDYRKWTVPLSRQDLWPGIHLTPDFAPTYFLGHTTNRRRFRSAQPTQTWRIWPTRLSVEC